MVKKQKALREIFDIRFQGILKMLKVGRARWLTLVIPALWEAETGGSRGQEFKTSLVNAVKPHLY